MSTDSPELAPITLVDLTEQDLVDIALADATVKLEEWQPREGNTEVVLLEAQALIAAELIYALNLLPDAVLEAVIGLYGLERDPGAPPSAPFEFSTSAAGGALVPAGTRVRLIYNVDDALDFLTDTDLLVPAGGTATVTATAEENTDALNGTPVGVTAELVDAILAVDTVDLAGDVTGGRVLEDSPTYRQRGANLFARLTSTLVLAKHFTAAALEFAGVYRATTVDLYNPDAGSGVPGDHPGHVTVAVGAVGGGPVDPETVADLVADLSSKAHAGLTVHAIAPTVTNVAVTASITTLAGYVEADVIAAVNAALEDYLNPDTWAWAGTVYRNELIALIDRVPGVDRVVSLTAPAADVALAGVAPLANAGALTVTVA